MLNRFALSLAMVILVVCVIDLAPVFAEDSKPAVMMPGVILPAPTFESKVTVEQALKLRRSVRQYSSEPLTLQQVSNLLWAAQGITDPATGHRTAPSAQATYPLRVYLIAGNVTGLPAGAYLYIPQGHKLELVASGDQRENVGTQAQMRTAPAVFAYIVDYTVVGPKYGKERAKNWASIEIGASTQNVLLEEVALGLIGVPMGGIDAAKLGSALKLSSNEEAVFAVSAAYKGAQAPAAPAK